MKISFRVSVFVRSSFQITKNYVVVKFVKKTLFEIIFFSRCALVDIFRRLINSFPRKPYFKGYFLTITIPKKMAAVHLTMILFHHKSAQITAKIHYLLF